MDLDHAFIYLHDYLKCQSSDFHVVKTKDCHLCVTGTEAMHSSHNPDPLPPAVASTTPSFVRAAVPDIVRPSNQSDENLRTGAAAVPFSSNQSLHSQVLRNPTAYPPEPKMQSSGASSGRPQPDLVQSPLEGAGAIRKAVVEVSNSVMGLKVSDTHSGSNSTPVSSAASELPTVSSDVWSVNKPAYFLW